MEQVDSILEQLMQSQAPRKQDAQEVRARAAVVRRLFKAYREKDDDLAAHYVRATEDIPLTFFAFAVIAIERSRVYPSLPATGELWSVARKAAGMDREQYHAGRYLPPPRDWPPEGQRHAIEAGELERLPRDAGLLLGAGEQRALPEHGTPAE